MWKAQIHRQITSKKTIVSKQQDGFASEAKAKEWAEQQLTEFTSTQGASNQRHGEQRKLNEEERRSRSNRRAEKTLKAKQAKAEEELKIAEQTEADTDSAE